MTEFGPKEQSRLAELLGATEKFCSCMSLPNGPLLYCICCGGTGKTKKRVPTGLVLIEECRKRGLRFIVDSWPDGGYVIECFIPGTSSRCVIRCNPANLESAIAIAALKGLETVANSESAN